MTVAHGFLETEAQAAAELVQMLRDMGADDDEQLVADTVEGQCSFNEAVSHALAQYDALTALAVGATERAKQLRERAERIALRAEKVHDAIREAMMVAGMKTLSLPEATLSVKSTTPGVLITDEALIPADYWHEELLSRVDKKAIREALKGGKAVPGAVLANSKMSLAVRRA